MRSGGPGLGSTVAVRHCCIVIAVSTADELHDALFGLFIAAAEAVARRLADLVIPTTVERPRMLVRRRPDGWSMDHRDEPHNVLTTDGINLRGAPWLTANEVAEIGRCASMIVERCGATLPFCTPTAGLWCPLIESLRDRAEPCDYERDPQDWVARMLVHPALYHHLVRLRAVDQADVVSARGFTDEVMQVAQATDITYLTCVPLSGIDLEPSDVDVLTEGRVTIRRLSEGEQADWSNYNTERILWRVEGAPEPPRVLLELQSSGPRNDWYQPSSEEPTLLVAAFDLHGLAVAGTIVSQRTDPSWVQWTHGGPLPLPRHCPNLTPLTAEALRAAVATAQRLDEYDLAQSGSPKDLALRRFVTGMARNNDTDAILDFTIALEALLLPDDPDAKRGDLSYRFRVHGAHYLANDAADRDATFKELRELYNTRSRLVHGGKDYPAGDVTRVTRESAHSLARRGLLRAVHEGFPKVDTFKRMVLGLAI